MVKGPSLPSIDNIFSTLDVELLANEEKAFMSAVQKQNPDLTIDEINERRWSKVVLLGKIDPPKIFCPWTLKETSEGQKIIPVALKRSSGCQKFRVPFRNESSKEQEVEFSFIKVGEGAGALMPNEFSMNEVLEFYCMPGTLKLPWNNNQVLTMLIKVNYEKLTELENSGKQLKN